MLFEYLIAAIVMGIVVAIPPGSVTVIACQRALRFGFGNSVFFSLGSCVSDIFYLFLVYLGVAHIISDNWLLKIILWFVCGVILIALGIQSLVTIKKNDGNGSDNEGLDSNRFATFMSGILVTLTNPMTIVGWIVIAGNFFLIWNDKFPGSRDYGVLAIGVIQLGVLIYFIPLTFIVSKLRKRMSDNLKKWLIIVSDICLIAFGVAAFYYAVNSIVASA
jgi:L-lysine exporter family protein LysE/ArgO